MKKQFTLVELIASVIVIAILALIVMLNITDFKKDAKETAYSVNEKEIQTAVDRYYLDHGLYPTEIQPTKGGVPQPVDYGKIVPKYIKKIPKQDFYIIGDGDGIIDIKNPDNLPTKDKEFIEKIDKILTCEDALAKGYDNCIETAAELDDIRNDEPNGVTLRHIIMNDIDLSSYNNWKAIELFEGELNGNGYKIKNLKIDSSVESAGLFATLSSATVKNIYFEKSVIQGIDYTGIIAGNVLDNSLVDNLVVVGTISAQGDFLGGLFGLTTDSMISNIKAFVDANFDTGNHHGGVFGGSAGNIKNVHFKGNVTSKGNKVGGLGGTGGQSSSHIMTQLSSIGTVSSSGNETGGLIGFVNGPLTNAQSHGKVSSTGDSVGGLVGAGYAYLFHTYSTAEVKGISEVGGLYGMGSTEMGGNSFATGNVTGQGIRVGGLFGMHLGFNTTSVYATGNVTNSGDYTGGLVGENNGTLEEAYARGNVYSSQNYTGGLLGRNNTMSNKLSAFGNVDAEGDYVGGLIGVNNGTISNVYAKGNVKTKGALVGGLIGLNNTYLDNAYATGNVSAEAQGTLNGESDFATGGLIGESNAYIKNVYATGNVTSKGNYVGGLVGRSSGSSMNGILYATGDVKSEGSYTGGLFGYHSGSVSVGAYALGDVTSTGDYTGGLAGDLYSDLENAYYKGTVVSKGSKVGGLAGETKSPILNSYALADITSGGDYTGGLVGNTYAEFEQVFYKGAITSKGSKVGGLAGETKYGAKNSYSSATINADGSTVGGLFGYSDSYDSSIENSYVTGQIVGSSDTGGLVGAYSDILYATVINSYWDMESTGQSTSPLGDGKTTNELKQKDTYVGWDFETIWKMNDEKGYPEFQ